MTGRPPLLSPIAWDGSACWRVTCDSNSSNQVASRFLAEVRIGGPSPGLRCAGRSSRSPRTGLAITAPSPWVVSAPMPQCSANAHSAANARPVGSSPRWRSPIVAAPMNPPDHEGDVPLDGQAARWQRLAGPGIRRGRLGSAGSHAGWRPGIVCLAQRSRGRTSGRRRISSAWRTASDDGPRLPRLAVRAAGTGSNDREPSGPMAPYRTARAVYRPPVGQPTGDTSRPAAAAASSAAGGLFATAGVRQGGDAMDTPPGPLGGHR